MKALASRFTGSVLVFATMKQGSDLSENEVDCIAELAEWGREYVRERHQARAPVIVLTGTELFSRSLQEAWLQKGGRHADFAKQRRVDKLRVLANLTQQLYLNMPSYETWFESEWEQRRKQGGRPVSSDGSI